MTPKTKNRIRMYQEFDTDPGTNTDMDTETDNVIDTDTITGTDTLTNADTVAERDPNVPLGCSGPIDFPDAVLNEEVREAIDKPTRDIFFDDVDDLVELHLQNRNISNQALILQVWGRLEEAMELHKKQEALCVELGNKIFLQASYNNQALILKDWGRLEEAMALQKKQETLCVELGNKVGLQ